ncbi:mechanosensitive ion channel [Pseudomonas aeruginosa]|uniref:mechanosensitive ion channel family protein n=1 Tax=Pseudomonas TaxID=286 RepID=UPI000B0DF673|nr:MULTISPECIES: mechanosensitive ion channel domain-containing protein [Pseudomonas]MCM5670961.1 mechanosensitive ion channel [Pseudomonas aeruginosa]MCM8577646.1 mechanosensitive ion channel [Pseudomonas aeruginosa]WPU59619.1 mechanosensitive ion channel [Pseudomonas asiatica]BBI40736.1 mechanosensitive ion channel protein [Pseudomonas sp.]
MQENFQAIIDQIPELTALYGMKILLALAVFFIGKWLAQTISRVISKGLEYRGVDGAVSSFFRQISYYGLLIVVAVAALGQLGVQTASFIAVIGAAGLAIGLALQGSLANFAAGVLLILFRPFRAGDYIEAAGTAGVVKEISIFSSTFVTPDNKTITVPNGGILDGNIVNYSLQAERRIDLEIGVSYGSDIEVVKRELLAVTREDERVLKDKDVTVGIMTFADSSINFVVRPWVRTADFWPVRFALMEAIKKRFDETGIEIPFPQMDVHVQKLPKE